VQRCKISLPVERKGETSLLGVGVLSQMRNLFVVPWLTPSRSSLLSIGAVAILVFSLFALLKVSTGERQEPAKELLTGSIQQSPAVRKPSSDDATASFVAPTAFQPTSRPVAFREVIPLPRPRPKRI
jgi:hypothetical protein